MDTCQKIVVLQSWQKMKDFDVPNDKLIRARALLDQVILEWTVEERYDVLVDIINNGFNAEKYNMEIIEELASFVMVSVLLASKDRDTATAEFAKLFNSE